MNRRVLALLLAVAAAVALLIGSQSAKAEAASQYPCITSTYHGEWGSMYSTARCGTSRQYRRVVVCEWFGTKTVYGAWTSNWGTSYARCPWPWGVQSGWTQFRQA